MSRASQGRAHEPPTCSIPYLDLGWIGFTAATQDPSWQLSGHHLVCLSSVTWTYNSSTIEVAPSLSYSVRKILHHVCLDLLCPHLPALLTSSRRLRWRVSFLLKEAAVLAKTSPLIYESSLPLYASASPSSITCLRAATALELTASSLHAQMLDRLPIIVL